MGVDSGGTPPFGSSLFLLDAAIHVALGQPLAKPTSLDQGFMAGEAIERLRNHVKK